jgi:hypothetical protein
MHTPIRVLSAAVLVFTSLVAVARTQHPAMPPSMTHDEHLKQMQKEADLKQRGTAAMGFDQDTTAHHFRLTTEGGRIDVTVNDASDATLAQIRSHLSGIATEFAVGDFSAPFATHGEVPAGVPTLEEQKGSIRYRYEDTPTGGRVVMATSDPKALTAIHEFLRYQIREHATGDPLTIER